VGGQYELLGAVRAGRVDAGAGVVFPRAGRWSWLGVSMAWSSLGFWQTESLGIGRKQSSPVSRSPPPRAWLTCAFGSVDEACYRLISVDIPAVEAQPEVEQDVPVVYNDYYTSWGEPREDHLLAIADRVVPLGVRYFVIDAGWYMPVKPNAHWATTLGDWRLHPSRFPNGLAGAAVKIRKCGLVPGI